MGSNRSEHNSELSTEADDESYNMQQQQLNSPGWTTFPITRRQTRRKMAPPTTTIYWTEKIIPKGKIDVLYISLLSWTF